MRRWIEFKVGRLGYILITIIYLFFGGASRNLKLSQNETLVVLSVCVIWLIVSFWRMNDIGGMSLGKKIGLIVMECIPLICLYPMAKCAFTVSEMVTPQNHESFTQEIKQPVQLSKAFPNSICKYFSTVSISKIRKIILLSIAVMTVVMCLFPPYKYNIPKIEGDNFIGYGTMISPPPANNHLVKYIGIDYKRLAFQEFILLVVCGATYIVITMNREE